MAMSNGTSTSIGVRAAHGDTANAACSSARPSASARATSRVDRAGQVVEVEEPLGAVEPLHPVVKCGAQQGMRIRAGRQPTAQPLRHRVGVAAELHQRADRQLGGQRRRRPLGRPVPLGQQGVDVGGPAVDVVRVAGQPPRHRLRHQRGATVHVARGVTPAGSAGQTASTALSRNGFGSPSAGAGAQCSTTPHASPAAADVSMMSLSSQRNSDGPRGLVSAAPQW